MGLPSIVTNINGSREIIKDGENGIIIPSHQVGTLYRAMKLFLTDKELRCRMSEKTRPMIASRYEQSYVRSCLKKYYKEILK